jgi:hypothetical protein
MNEAFEELEMWEGEDKDLIGKEDIDIFLWHKEGKMKR